MQNFTGELSLADIFRVLWKNKIVIILLLILGFAVAFAKSSYFTDDTYTASGILYVSNRNDFLDDEEITASDIVTSRTLTTTYIEILKTPSFLKKVKDDACETLSAEGLQASVNIEVIGETELLRVTVTAKSREEAFAMAESLFENAPDKLKSVYQRGEVATVDPPVMPTAANSKGTLNNALIGAIVGAILGVAFAFVRHFLDTRVRSSEDLEKRYGITVLGEIAG